MTTLLPLSLFLETGIAFSALLTLFATVLLLLKYRYRYSSEKLSLSLWTIAYGCAFLLTWSFTRDVPSLFATLVIHALLVISLSQMRSTISLFGVFYFTSMISLPFFGFLWLWELMHRIAVHYQLTQWLYVPLLISTLLLSCFLLLSSIFTGWGLLVRFAQLYFFYPRLNAGWKIAKEPPSYTPLVSIHIPCYAEPPQLVIETLNAISRLEYPNYEVIVLDNNTENPLLWKPVEEHCQKLGECFRFFHLSPIQGAKAGALNAALSRTSPQVELIAVIDADFQVKPNFLSELTGFFKDPKIAYVQTCQDFRECHHSPYLKGCYYEYEVAFKLLLSGVSEWDASFTVGTMCLIRRTVLQDVGGWSEWCLTEDSEVAVRIHAAGYAGYYLNYSLGYGLVPETFETYKKQRFRWTAGAAQQIQKHWRLYLPWPRASRLSLMQKASEVFHSVAVLFEVVTLVVMMATLGVAVSLALAKQQVYTVPALVLLLVPLTCFRNLVHGWVNVRLLGGRWKDALYSWMATRSLLYIRFLAFLMVWMPVKLQWERSNKFKSTASFWKAFYSCRAEVFLGLLTLLAIALIAPLASYTQPDLIFFGLLGLIYLTCSFFCAPLMAYLSEKDLER